MKTKKAQANMLLLLAALIWGSAFVAQKSGMQYLGPFSYNAARSLLASAFLLPFILLSGAKAELRDHKKTSLAKVGLLCGLLMCAFMTFQQVGLQYTTTAKTAFITSLYMVMVPIFGVFFGRRLRPSILLGVVLAALGLYLLCVPKGADLSGINKGDAMMVVSALVGCAYIYAVDILAPEIDGALLSCIQFAVTGFISLFLAILFERDAFSFQALLDCAIPILYSGILSSGVASTLQLYAQKHTDPTSAVMLMSLETVFATIFAALLLSEFLNPRELMGCALMFSATLFVQLMGARKGEG